MKTNRIVSFGGLWLLYLVLSAGTPQAYAVPVYVNDNATGINDGSSWTDAFNDLQSALDIAQLGDEIRVAGGTYKPSMLVDTDPPNPPRPTFQLVNGVALRGCYIGLDTNPEARDFSESNRTILTGDLDDDGDSDVYHVVFTSSCQAGTILDGVTVMCSSREAMYNDPYSTTVATISSCTFRDNMGSAIAYGELTITNCIFSGNHAISGGALRGVFGTLNGCIFEKNSAESYGGAIYGDFVDLSDLAMTDCVFKDNTAGESGGAIEVFGSLEPITKCVFTSNIAGSSGGAIHSLNGNQTFVGCVFERNLVNGTGFYPRGGGAVMDEYLGTNRYIQCLFVANSAPAGGAVYSGDESTLDFVNCTLAGNTAGVSGGAIEGLGSITSMINCAFTQNVAVISGGAIHSLSCTQSLVGCAFVANRAPTGGAVYSGDAGVLDVVNCTLAGNSATNGSAFACDSADPLSPSTLTITNCIAWDGGGEIWNNDGSTITVAYSDIQGWVGTENGNINADPKFVRAPAGTDLGDLHLTVGSPCVDAGNTTALPPSFLLDLDGTSRVKGPAVDMGVYELAEVIPAGMDMIPRILYKNSFFRWVFAFITLPTGFDVASIDVDTIAITKIERLCCPDCPPIEVNSPLGPVFSPWIGDYNHDGIPDLTVIFDCQDLLHLLQPGFYKITVSGMLETDDELIQPFEGSEIICVIGRCR
jgi:predicted outer membrane repeat protein